MWQHLCMGTVVLCVKSHRARHNSSRGKLFEGFPRNPAKRLRSAFTSTKLCTHPARLTFAKGDSNRRLQLLIQSIPIMTATALETGEGKEKTFPQSKTQNSSGRFESRDDLPRERESRVCVCVFAVYCLLLCFLLLFYGADIKREIYSTPSIHPAAGLLLRCVTLSCKSL